MPGFKNCLERCLGVEFGPHSFKSGIPRVLVPGCVMMFVAVFFIVVGILLCGIHAAYKVSKVDEVYRDYFLIAGIIALVIGMIVALVGTGWCCHVKRNLADEMDYYRDTKLSRSASLRSNISQGGLATVTKSDLPQDWRYQPQVSRQSHQQYPDEEYEEDRYPDPGYRGSYPDPDFRTSQSDQVYDPVTDTYIPRHAYHSGHQVPLPAQHVNNRDSVTRLNDKINDGVKGIQDFVHRNKEYSKNGSSPRRKKVPYSDRMKDFQGIAVDEPHANEEFDLAKMYNKPEPKYYADHHHQPGNGMEHDNGGYANIPDTYNAHIPRSQRPASATQQPPNSTEYPPPPPQNKKKNKRGQSESAAMPTHQQQPHVKPQHAENYKYNQGRPLDSSVDSTTAAGEQTTLVYNPKDGRWYYYYKGRPVSEYTGENPEKEAAEGPSYRYINGKPVVVTENTASKTSTVI